IEKLSLYSAENLRNFLNLNGASGDMFRAVRNISERRAMLSEITGTLSDGFRFGQPVTADPLSDTDKKLLEILKKSEKSFAEIADHLNTAYEIYCQSMEPLYRIYDNCLIPVRNGSESGLDVD
ncbi:MAG: hypothetical protein IKS74_00805, partial [Methanomicrobium sp.]|nr:hypothetical protein [Methanomicrobium sp.]